MLSLKSERTKFLLLKKSLKGSKCRFVNKKGTTAASPKRPETRAYAECKTNLRQ